MSERPAHERAVLAAQASYGRLLALLTSFTHDIAAAEDALAEAFVAALAQWPQEGVPARPEAWLLTVARRRVVDVDRRERGHQEVVDALGVLTAWTTAETSAAVFPDKRLALLFVCAHPAIDPAARTPLMLQTVLGLDAVRIASALHVAPKTMGQRLWRAKAKIRDAGMAFEVPGADELPERLDAVLDAIYAAFGSAWEDISGEDPVLTDLAAEAQFLAELVVDLLPVEPEPRGLLALILFTQARRAARRDQRGCYVPLAEQDPARWSQPDLRRAEHALTTAATAHRLGPFQLEAAIQSAHVAARRGAPDTTEAIVRLYEGLVRLAPSLGAWVARAAAIANAAGPTAGLAALDALDATTRATYQPAWALRAHLLALLGRTPEARAAYTEAIRLTAAPAVRTFLAERLAAL